MSHSLHKVLTLTWILIINELISTESRDFLKKMSPLGIDIMYLNYGIIWKNRIANVLAKSVQGFVPKPTRLKIIPLTCLN
jgi:hypothetical protein